MGMNEERLSGYDIDSTLIRLTIDNNGREESKQWEFQLPNLLSAFKARSLQSSSDILLNPIKYNNLQNRPDWKKDEYYIVHAEGYKYKHESSKRKHSIKPGFSLQERGDIVNQVLQLLDNVLIPDEPIQTDIPTPSGQNTPLAMRDYKFISQPKTITKQQKEKLSQDKIQELVAKHHQERKIIIANAIQRVLTGKFMYIFLLWRERDTHDIVYQSLRDVFLLNEDEDFPDYIKLLSVWIDNDKLLKPLDTNGLAPKDGQEFDKQISKEYQHKREEWRKSL
ncbi:MAG TPA: hypothetical protein DEF48_12145 [Nostoc sp. UBA8866]|uniref:Uncharacterized protein n=2 Tax=Nostocaceae TaxID=1162 RepID=A0A1Z4KF12_ANAVA|nr:hypothetical protein NIES23_03620 [Trichormus variabilis NIES-23]HBW30814.1 hypothetical protein [Nostoc sp. UBA8866]